MAVNPGKIMVQASKARRHLRELVAEIANKIELDALLDGIHADNSSLADCADRFDIWAGSLGVFQKGEASLDARLSNHLILHEVVRLLNQLDVLVSDLRGIVDGSHEQRTWTKSSLHIDPLDFSDPEDFSSGSEQEDTALASEAEGGDDEEIFSESKDLHLAIDEAITSLLRLSVVVSKSSRRAKFAKSSIDENYSVGPDINHVRDFFPHAARNEPLLEKLGKANAQRRQWLWYRRRHREKLSMDASGPRGQMLSLPDALNEVDYESLALTSIDDQRPAPAPSLTGTRASTFRSHLDVDAYTNSRGPDTVFGRSSLAAPGEQRLLVPEPPHDLILGRPYYCRYCCSMVEIQGKHAWQKHVFTDLSPYTCTFPDCDELFFESRHKWWAHEMEYHRQQWRCGICGLNLSTKTAMTGHLKAIHSEQIPDGQEEIVTNAFGRPVSQINASDCALCDYPSIIRARGHLDDEGLRISPEKFGRHLSRHLEQVSLFVLPVSDLVDEDEMSETGVHGEESDSDDEVNETEAEILSEPDLVQKLIEVSSSQTGRADKLSDPPDLAMRWQPPQDFTPPLDDFYTDDVDLLPGRQEPIFGGDLHTSGWARGSGRRKEGFCARCPISHWVNIPDGSYAFHLTYFHGVPASGVPLPRPAVIRQVPERAGNWEGYCEACVDWKLLKKTRRGWNWYRHWLNDHKDIVKKRTDAITNGTNPEPIPSSTDTALPSVMTEVNLDIPAFKEQGARYHGEGFGQISDLGRRLLSLAKDDKSHEIEASLRQFSLGHTPEEMERLLGWTNDLGQNLLMISAAQGLHNTVELVLSFGGNPNQVDLEGQTALDLATDAGFFETAHLLIKNGADASRSHVFKRIFSNERAYAGEMTQAVADASTSDDFKSSSLSALGQSALTGDVKSIRNLLGNDDGPSSCDIEEGAEMGTPAFLLACEGSHLEAADLLLSRGANINAVSQQGWTTLMLACKKDDAKLVSFLLSRGADVNHLSPDRWTALTEATSKGSTGIMRMLLGAGADTEVRAQSDWTPLMYAAYRGDIEAVDLLLDSGASFEEVSARDATPMLLAAASGNPTVVLRLLNAGCRPDSLWSIAQAEVRETTEMIGEGSAGAVPPSLTAPKTTQERIERVYKVGWTPLMVAAQIGSLEIVVTLLDAGANPYSKSPMFKTAFEIARENGRLDVAEYLESQL